MKVFCQKTVCFLKPAKQKCKNDFFSIKTTNGNIIKLLRMGKSILLSKNIQRIAENFDENTICTIRSSFNYICVDNYNIDHCGNANYNYKQIISLWKCNNVKMQTAFTQTTFRKFPNLNSSLIDYSTPRQVSKKIKTNKKRSNTLPKKYSITPTAPSPSIFPKLN